MRAANEKHQQQQILEILETMGEAQTAKLRRLPERRAEYRRVH